MGKLEIRRAIKIVGGFEVMGAVAPSKWEPPKSPEPPKSESSKSPKPPKSESSKSSKSPEPPKP